MSIHLINEGIFKLCTVGLMHLIFSWDIQKKSGNPPSENSADSTVLLVFETLKSHF